MITGFNTDIEHNGVTYHVQTEDKGLKTPLILSLVYHRGTILASKRSPYDDLLNGSLDEKELSKRLQRQHKLICAAIQAGRVEDLKRMNMKDSAQSPKGLIAQKEIPLPADEKEILLRAQVPIAIPKPARKGQDVPVIETVKAPAKIEQESPIQRPDPIELKKIELEKSDDKPLTEMLAEEVWEMPISIVDDTSPGPFFEPIFEGVSIVEEEVILAAEAVQIITDPAKYEAASSDKLSIGIINEKPFKGGESHVLNIVVSRGKPGDSINGANVMIKVLGSSFRPLIFHSKTDNNGVATVSIQIPSFSRGRAAVLIKAMTGTEEAELRKIIHPG